ncbi:MAG: 1A family penicillin-binding protein [Microgenomates group bacterium Gr01-1014_16]|nr:MAG: 1A family penicillin-binding protein [Microgenomates group bacterium Gr01-1014_16]
MARLSENIGKDRCCEEGEGGNDDDDAPETALFAGEDHIEYDCTAMRVKKAWVASIATAGFVTVVGGIVVLVGGLAWVAKDLPSPDRIVRREGFSTKIYDRNEKLLYDVYADQRRTPVELDQVPLILRQATIAIEDKNFYKHQGFDPLGIFRALFRTVVNRRLEGGSTLTQQLVKNVLLTSQRTLSRKVKEFILTLQVEQKYKKDQILQMYLNEAPYGGTAWGVEAASEMYFGKPVGEVNLPEAAILAGLPQLPSVYSPYVGNAYVGRAESVLRRMREDGYISKNEEEVARATLSKVEISTQSGLLKAPHFVFYVRNQLIERYGERAVEQGGLRVTTTLDLDLQEAAQKVVSEEISKVKHLKITNGAAVVEDVNNGQILAMVGSRGWSDPDYDGKYNVTTALRQPGSAIKPVVYVTGLRKGFTAATLLMDTKTVFPGGDKPEYIPENYDGKYHGPILVREALGNSINVPAVKMLSLVGIKDMLQVGYDMGLTTLNPTPELLKRVGLSMALGGGEVRLLDMVSAYSAFGNGGKKVESVAILKVMDSGGKILEEWRDGSKNRVLDSKEVFIISSILSDVKARELTFGTRSALVVEGRTIAVKTGTTNDKRDNWTVGWTAGGRIAGVWVGNNNNSSMLQVASGVTGAAPIWRRIMREAIKDIPNQEFLRPDGIVELEVDAVSGYPAHDGFSSKKEYFIAGTEPTGDDPVHKMNKVCKGEGKLATPTDVGSGNYDSKEAFYFAEDDPKWQEGINAWLGEQADAKYHPPTEFCSGSNPMWIVINEPVDRSRIDNNDVKFRLDIQDSNKITKVEFYIDDELRETLTNSPWEVVINMPNGSHQIDIKAKDEKGFDGSRRLFIGVNQDYEPPTPAP